MCNFVARIVKGTFKIDDTLDVFACHGVGGLIGSILTGILADKAVNSAVSDTALIANLKGAAAVAIYSMIVTFIIIKLVNLISPLRVSEEDEKIGLDTTEHGEAINNN